MLKVWFSANELVGLPGMPKTDRAIRIRAEKQCWQSKPKDKGKGLEFHISSLPLETKNYLKRSHLNADISETETASCLLNSSSVSEKRVSFINESDLLNLQKLSDDKKEKAQAKIAILNAYKLYIEDFKNLRKLGDAEINFAQKFNSRELKIDSWIYQHIETVSVPSLRRWAKTLSSEGCLGLAGKHKKTKLSLFEQYPEMADFVLALVTSKPHMLSKSREVRNLLNVKRMEW